MVKKQSHKGNNDYERCQINMLLALKNKETAGTQSRKSSLGIFDKLLCHVL
jgi:hypothetical protein